MIARSALRRFSSATRLLNNRNIIPVNSSLGNQIRSQKKSNNNAILELQNRGQLLSFSTTSKLRCEAKTDLQKKIDGLINESSVVVFMKGVPAQPQCGFSNAVCQIMRMHDVPFVGHNILLDEEVRTEIKSYKGWPTFPQVYFDGEFIGGCDVLIEMHQSGELIEELGKIGIKSALLTAEEKK